MFDSDNHSNYIKTRMTQAATDLSSEWSLQVKRLLTLLPELDVIAVGEATLLIAQSRVACCEACDRNAARSFSSVLDEVTSRCDRPTDYLMPEPATCRNCHAPILETTLVGSERKTDQIPVVKYFDTPIEETNVVFVPEDILSRAEQSITACEQCSEGAESSFDQVLDSLMDCGPTTTDYLMCRQAKCPCCHGTVTERTLVIPT